MDRPKRQPEPSRRVAAGGKHTCALRVDGSAVCWGANDVGQTDVPDRADAPSKLSVWDRIRLGHLSNRNGDLKEISAGSAHSCAIRADDTLLCWGYNNPGVLNPQVTEGQAAPPGGTFKAVAAGGNHSCGLRTDGGVACWGAGADLVDHLGITGLETISAHSQLSCGLRTDRSIDCWNGVPDFDYRSHAYRAVSAGNGYVCGLRDDGTIRCGGRSAGSIVTA